VKEDRDLFATTRSLFIGLDQLEIVRQSEFQYGASSILESEASATLDNQPFSLLVYSERTPDNCVRDLLLWTVEAGEKDSDKWKEILQDKSRVMDLLRKE